VALSPQTTPAAGFSTVHPPAATILPERRNGVSVSQPTAGDAGKFRFQVSIQESEAAAASAAPTPRTALRESGPLLSADRIASPASPEMDTVPTTGVVTSAPHDGSGVSQAPVSAPRSSQAGSPASAPDSARHGGQPVATPSLTTAKVIPSGTQAFPSMPDDDSVDDGSAAPDGEPSAVDTPAAASAAPSRPRESGSMGAPLGAAVLNFLPGPAGAGTDADPDQAVLDAAPGKPSASFSLPADNSATGSTPTAVSAGSGAPSAHALLPGTPDGFVSSTIGRAAMDPHGTVSASPRAGEAPELSAGLRAWNGGDNPQTAAAQSAHLLDKLGSTEMNIAWKGEALGAVQVRAHLTGDQVGAAIAVERHDAHTLLSSDLPTLHQALNDRQLRLESVSLFQGSLPGGPEIGGEALRDQQQRGAPQRPWQGEAASAPFPEGESMAVVESPESHTAFDLHGRLSVRA
jgi:hypothetical protein